jgi:hypothetical protein
MNSISVRIWTEGMDINALICRHSIPRCSGTVYPADHLAGVQMANMGMIQKSKIQLSAIDWQT